LYNSLLQKPLKKIIRVALLNDVFEKMFECYRYCYCRKFIDKNVKNRVQSNNRIVDQIEIGDRICIEFKFIIEMIECHYYGVNMMELFKDKEFKIFLDKVETDIWRKALGIVCEEISKNIVVKN
jgi:hypothetical protein